MIRNKYIPLQQLPNGQWLVAFSLNHRNVFTGDAEVRYHQVQFTNKPTVEMLKRRLRTFVMAYPDELKINVNEFDFSPYLIY